MFLLPIYLMFFCAGLASCQTSCQGRCRESYNPSNPCHCNDRCSSYNSCCGDYDVHCGLDSGTCRGRCNSPYDARQPCQCHTGCENYGECCSDYAAQCPSAGTCAPISITSAQIREISLEIFDSDVNSATSNDIEINPQTQTGYDSSTDVAPEKFFTSVSHSLLQRATYVAFLNLLDNYDRNQGVGEVETTEERKEQDNFISAFMDTAVGKKLYMFLKSKGRAGCGDQDTFKDLLKKIWFGLYGRGGRSPDSCGFEHVFVGELASGAVSGFHNWVQFYNQENSNHLNYFGYVKNQTPYLFSMRFTWDRFMKNVGGILIGSSPEYELAVFTLCHLARPDRSCRIVLRDDYGEEVKRIIRAYPWTTGSPADGWKYVSTTFFAVY